MGNTAHQAIEDQILMFSYQREHGGEIICKFHLLIRKCGQVFFFDSAQEIVVGYVFLSADSDVHEANQIRRTVIVDEIHVLWRKLGIDILLEVEVILLHVVQTVEVLVFDERNDFFFTQIVNVDFHTVVHQPECDEIVPYKCLHQLLFHDEIPRQTAKCKGDLHTALIAVADEVKDCDIGFVVKLTQTTSELLDKNS